MGQRSPVVDLAGKPVAPAPNRSEYERLLSACLDALLADDIMAAEALFDECMRRIQREAGGREHAGRARGGPALLVIRGDS